MSAALKLMNLTLSMTYSALDRPREQRRCLYCGERDTTLREGGTCDLHLEQLRNEKPDDPEHDPDNGDVGLLGMGGNRWPRGW